MSTPNGDVHSVINQSEYPRKERGLRAPVQRESERTNFGFPLPGPNRFYHLEGRGFGWPGYFIPWDVYGTEAILPDTDPYQGEAFLRMQTQGVLPHPSGLPDTALLGGEELAEMLRGGG